LYPLLASLWPIAWIAKRMAPHRKHDLRHSLGFQRQHHSEFTRKHEEVSIARVSQSVLLDVVQ
jgi:hypothetical protein